MMYTRTLDALREGTAHLESGPPPALSLATPPVQPAQLLDCMTRYSLLVSRLSSGDEDANFAASAQW
jgi:hypothetical protein